MRRKSIAYEHEEAQINLTPLIDVVFVVLIIFIIIAPMLEVDRVDLANGTAGATKPAATTDHNPIAIHVHQDNTIWLQGKCVSPDQLARLLKEARRSGNLRAPQLFQDKRACFGTYQTVKNAIECAGYDELDVILKPG